MKKLFLALASSAAAIASPALGQIAVDGQRDAEYGAAAATVATNPTAPVGNFQAPTNEATAGYNIYLNDDGTNLNAFFEQTGGSAAGQFANLYFDLNPTVGDGSDLGFEIGLNSVTAFIPGKNGQPGFSTLIDPSLYQVAAGMTGGMNLFEVSLATSLFKGPIAGLSYYDGQTFEGAQTLRLSQTFSYSVAGGASYGPNRLGAFNVSGAVPEPATWGMMLLGFGAIGAVMRRTRRRPAVAQIA